MVLAALVISPVIHGGQAKPAHALPFAPGETLKYNVTWSIFPAGQVVARLKELGAGPNDAYEVDTTAHSTGFVSLLFNLNNHYESVFDSRTLCSRTIDKTINEGRRHKKTQIVFNSARRLAVLREVDLSNSAHAVKQAQHPIPPCVEDIISSFYFLRRQPMDVGKEIRLPINDGSVTREVVVNVESRVRLQTALGPRVAFRVEPHALGDLYKKKGRLFIWFSDDAQRLPLRIKAVMVIGAITGNLVSVGEHRQPPPRP
jgi:hypothetical protein